MKVTAAVPTTPTATRSGVSATYSSFQPKFEATHHGSASISSVSFSFLNPCLSFRKLKAQVGRLGFGAAATIASHRPSVRCYSSSGSGGPGSGDNESRNVLDAFFLGKALAETLNERLESAVGEFLSTIGRLQAEQQRQIRDFQDDVLERARKAKEKAARETMETQGLVSKPTTVGATIAAEDNSPPPPSSVSDVASANSSPDSIISSAAETGQDFSAKGPV